MSFEEALDLLGDNEAFRATVYAINTLLIEKGIYQTRELEEMVCEYAENFKAGFTGKSKRAKGTSRATVHANP